MGENITIIAQYPVVEEITRLLLDKRKYRTIINFINTNKNIIYDTLQMIQRDFREARKIPPTIIDKWGTKNWYKNGQKHRDNDLPAIINFNGDKYWFQNGKLHRENDLPVVVCHYNNKYWHRNGQLHRDNDLPAVIYFNGDKFWYQNGRRQWGKYTLLL